LLVDDNAVQAETRRAILARAGNDVTVAGSASAALVVLHDHHFVESLGLIITDHLMPGMNGPEFIKLVRRIAPQLPVMVITGLAEAEAEYDGLDVIFRMKPFPPDQLIALVRSLVQDAFGRTA
jgi:CheY-like chemotaxis protein